MNYEEQVLWRQYMRLYIFSQMFTKNQNDKYEDFLLDGYTGDYLRDSAVSYEYCRVLDLLVENNVNPTFEETLSIGVPEDIEELIGGHLISLKVPEEFNSVQFLVDLHKNYVLESEHIMKRIHRVR